MATTGGDAIERHILSKCFGPFGLSEEPYARGFGPHGGFAVWGPRRRGPQIRFANGGCASNPSDSSTAAPRSPNPGPEYKALW
eukprot:5620422-Alexandrium_andersonii.AAC.1